MTRVSPQMRNFAKRLIAIEAKGNKPLAIKSIAVFRVCDKLRPQLEPLVGKSGFRSLLSRALALAVVEAPALRVIQVKSDGTLEVPEEAGEDLKSSQVFEDRVLLLAHLLGLLVAFIGQNLTFRLLNEIWPKVPLHNLELEEGEKNEKNQ